MGDDVGDYLGGVQPLEVNALRGGLPDQEGPDRVHVGAHRGALKAPLSSLGQQAGSAGARAREAEAEAEETRESVSELRSQVSGLQNEVSSLKGQQNEVRDSLERQSEAIAEIRQTLREEG